MAEAGPEVIEALLLDLANHSGQGPKTKDLERPEMPTRIDMSKMSTNWVGSN